MRPGRRLKVLYVIGTLDVGGAEGQLVQLATRLDRARFEPVVCCLSAAGPHAATLQAAGIRVEVIGFQGFRFFRHPYEIVARLGALVRCMRRERPHIVHGYLFWAYILATFTARLARVPVVLASRRSLGNFKEGVRHYLAMERLANRMTDCILANSEAVRRDVVRQERLDSSRIRVIYNGIDPSLYEAPPDPQLRESLGIPQGAPVVGVVARLVDYKGHRAFLAACPEVLRQHPQTRFLLIGDGPDREALARVARAQGLEAHLCFLGTRQDIPQLLGLLDVVVLPSLEEGFPNAILEAMAAARPVVASRVGGVPEAVVDGETGLLVPSRDPAALAAAIARLLGDPALRSDMGAAGQRRVGERFSLSRMVGEMEALYEELGDGA